MGNKVVQVFDIPPKLAKATGVASIGMVIISTEEELSAYKRSAGNSAKLAGELAKTSLVEVDGKRISPADGSVDTWWNEADPRVRQLVLTAYADIHGAKEEDTESFLASRKLRAE